MARVRPEAFKPRFGKARSGKKVRRNRQADMAGNRAGPSGSQGKKQTQSTSSDIRQVMKAATQQASRNGRDKVTHPSFLCLENLPKFKFSAN